MCERVKQLAFFFSFKKVFNILWLFEWKNLSKRDLNKWKELKNSLSAGTFRSF